MSMSLSCSVNPQQKTFLKIFVLLVMFNAMERGDTRTIFDQLIPSEGNNCTGPGEYGCLCERKLDCSSEKYLECIDGKCECEYPLHRYFDLSIGKCVNLVGTMCTSTWGGGESPECTRNAECEGGRCTCRQGYSRTTANKCKINYGAECGPNQCNAERGLACKEGKCVCKDSKYVYSVIHTNCLDPEQVVRNIIQQIVNRFVRGILQFKGRRVTEVVTAPFRLLIRMLLGPVGILLG